MSEKEPINLNSMRQKPAEKNEKIHLEVDQKLYEWFKEGLIGKVATFKGYHFQGEGPEYRAKVAKFDISTYEGGDQFDFKFSDMEKYNPENDTWEETADVVASQGHTIHGVSLEGNTLKIGNATVHDVIIPDEFMPKNKE